MNIKNNKNIEKNKIKILLIIINNASQIKIMKCKILCLINNKFEIFLQKLKKLMIIIMKFNLIKLYH